MDGKRGRNSVETLEAGQNSGMRYFGQHHAHVCDACSAEGGAVPQNSGAKPAHERCADFVELARARLLVAPRWRRRCALPLADQKQNFIDDHNDVLRDLERLDAGEEPCKTGRF